MFDDFLQKFHESNSYEIVYFIGESELLVFPYMWRNHITVSYHHEIFLREKKLREITLLKADLTKLAWGRASPGPMLAVQGVGRVWYKV